MRLRSLADDISGAPWVQDDVEGTVRGADRTIVYDYSAAYDDGPEGWAEGKAQGAYTATMNPTVALDLARLLDRLAWAGSAPAEAFAVARAINGTA